MEIRKICQWCGKPFIAQKTTTCYCSHQCSNLGYKERIRERKRQLKRSQELLQPRQAAEGQYLIICLLEFHSTALQLNLNQWKPVNKNGYIITAFLSPFHRDLVGHLKLILTPLLTVEKFYPNAFAVCRVKRI